MKRVLAFAFGFALVAHPAFAFYTECTATKDVDGLNRPQGNIIGRWSPVKKGERLQCTIPIKIGTLSYMATNNTDGFNGLF
jgi:hypothetical protein